MEAIAAVPFIIALVEVFKRALDLETKYAPLVAVVLGLTLGLFRAAAAASPVASAYLDAGLIGIMWGLSAAGLYDLAGKRLLAALTPGPEGYE